MSVFVRSCNGFGGAYAGGDEGMLDGNPTEIGQDVNCQRQCLKLLCPKGNNKREEGGEDRGGGRLEKTKRDKNERKRQSRSHHQTNTRAGLPFLTDSNGKEEKNKGS